MSRSYRGISESQANADALACRDTPYSAASGVSFAVSWDYRRREPVDLRDAVRQVRRAYSDEVPTKLHEGPDSIGEGGTPKMTPQAEGYLFGSPGGSDAGYDPETGQRDAVSWHNSPFRARLNQMEHGNETDRRRAAIVAEIAIGGRGPVEAGLAVSAHPCDAKLVAEDAIRAFLRGLSDLKLNLQLARPVG